jgi:hypothetical protein
MALNANADWELVAEQVANRDGLAETDGACAEFNGLLSKRERLLRQSVTKSG